MLTMNISASESKGNSPAYLTQDRAPRARIVQPVDRALELKTTLRLTPSEVETTDWR